MQQGPSTEGLISAERLAFRHYLRTGAKLPPALFTPGFEAKFNPYHDPRNGRFTFAPGGPRPAYARLARRPAPSAARLIPAQYRPPRTGIGGNGGPPLQDPLTLEQAFPALRTAPAGSLVALADNILDLTGPATRLTTELSQAHVAHILNQIRAIDPHYRYDSLGFPTTLDGQANLITDLRFDRAVAFYKLKGEARPLQVEVLRMMQKSADIAYAEGARRFDLGLLQPRLSREEAIGNFVDRSVREDLRAILNDHAIDHSKGQQVRVVGREYDSSKDQRNFRIPDARVGTILFDVTLSRKTYSTPQIRGFFGSDFGPEAVIIIRPSQVGPPSSYALPREDK